MGQDVRGGEWTSTLLHNIRTYTHTHKQSYLGGDFAAGFTGPPGGLCGPEAGLCGPEAGLCGPEAGRDGPELWCVGPAVGLSGGPV